MQVYSSPDQFSIQPFCSLENCYLLFDAAQHDAIVIDPGKKDIKLVNFIKTNNLQLKYIVLTHAHPDHTGGLGFLKENFPNAQVSMHKSDMGIFPKIILNKKLLLPDLLFEDEPDFNFGKFTLKTLHVSGHTGGSCLFYSKEQKVAFTGDSLFAKFKANVSFPGSTGEFEYSQSVIKMHQLMGDQYTIYPGHFQFGANSGDALKSKDVFSIGKLLKFNFCCCCGKK